MLQEAPPWWPAELAAALGVEQRTALTSRNSLPALRRAVARRDAELLKSNGGGCNAVLSRLNIVEHDTMRLAHRGPSVVSRSWCVYTTAPVWSTCTQARAERALSRSSLVLWQRALRFADGAPLILGGDLNLRGPVAPGADIAHVAAENVDHVFTRGFATAGEAQVLTRSVALGARRVELSDHAPLSVDVGQPTGSHESARRAC